MEVDFGDIITISFIERCDGKIVDTNIEDIARDNGIYDEEYDYGPTAINVGNDDFPDGLHDELVGKEVGAKGTVIIPPEKAYGERSSEYVRSMNKKEFDKVPSIGEIVPDSEYGDGIVVNKIGSQFIIDFNHKFAGKEIEYEYEIHEIIINPAEQFFRILDHLLTHSYEASFEEEDGSGIISVKIPTKGILWWNADRVDLTLELFGKHPSLDTLEFREEYENIFHTMEQGEVDAGSNAETDNTTESEEIKAGDLITFNFIKHCDGEVVDTNIEEIAVDNDLYDDDYEYAPDVVIIGSKPTLGYLDKEFIGKKVGAKGTVIIPAEEAYGVRSKEKVHSIDRKELPKDAKIGSYIQHDEYGDGFIVNKIGKKFVVDFNHIFAGNDIECEYEILEKITDPAEQFDCMMWHLGPRKYDASFENGRGTVNLEVPLLIMNEWSVKKIRIILELFKNLPFLETLEFREKYTSFFTNELSRLNDELNVI